MSLSATRLAGARPRTLLLVGVSTLALVTVFRLQQRILELSDALQQLQLVCQESQRCQEEVRQHAAAASLPLPPLASLSTDLFLRNLGGSPLDDPPQTQRFVMALAVGTRLVATVDQLVQRLDLSLVHVVLFHYDGISGMRAWEAVPWHEQAVHICALRQTKWWFAKRFLTPPLVGRYELIFVWDEDLGVDFGFDFNRLVDVVRAHDLQISQPSVVGPVSWPITRRVPGSEVHKHSALKYNSEPCEAADMDKPPCGAMVEVQAPVFTPVAWNCVWAMLQNDLVHAFGIDMAWHVCAAVGNRSAADAMGIIDASPVEHLRIPSLAQQGRSVGEEPPWVSINQRRDLEWAVWNARWEAALRVGGGKRNDP